MVDYLKRAWAEIDLDAIAHNCRQIDGLLKPGCRVMAIVKADAYGHGAGFVSRALQKAGVSWFGVSNLDEALQIRQEGIEDNILILGYTPPCNAASLAEHRITQTVFGLEYAERLNSAAIDAGVKVKIHIKLDTGMSRIGFFCQNDRDFGRVVNEIETVCSMPGLEYEGIYTHFASADSQEDDNCTRAQFEMFTHVIDRLKSRGVFFRLCHCCNSAAIMRFPEMHLDMVRPGLSLYGLFPSPNMESVLPLKPAMELKSVVSMVKTVPKGASISYGRTFRTKGETKLATLPIGYADGYPRTMSNCAYMLINGQRVPVVGRVCMDQCMLDVTAVVDVCEGAVVTVFGRDGSFISVDEIAGLSGTINYETLCLIGKRVPRIYKCEGRVIGKLSYMENNGG